MFSPYCLRAGRLIAEALGMLLGVPVPPSAPLVFAVQVRRETADGDADRSPGVRGHNPLNLMDPWPEADWPGQVGHYSGGNEVEFHRDFAAFGSLEAGAWACASNYAADTYADVQRAFRGGDPIALAEAVQASPWDSGHYGGTFVDEVRAELGQEEQMTEEQIREIAKAECRAVLSNEAWLRDTIAAAVKQALAEASRKLAA